MLIVRFPLTCVNLGKIWSLYRARCVRYNPIHPSNHPRISSAG